MNRENLKKMADHLDTVKPEIFEMSVFSKDQETAFSCNSVGCAIGHCSVLEENPERYTSFINFKDVFDYNWWSENFTGLDNYSKEWIFLFSGTWELTDNTPAGAAARIRYLLDKGLPDGWYHQMHGITNLSYGDYIKK